MDSVKYIIVGLILGFLFAEGHFQEINKIRKHHGHIKNYPFQVTVEVNGKAICGGAILGDQWVITSSSCLPDNISNTKGIKIRAGSNLMNHGGIIHEVSKLVLDNGGGNDFMRSEALDIAVIKVKIPFIQDVNTYWSRPAVQYLKESDEIEIAGWGLTGNLTYHAHHFFKRELHIAKVKMISADKCEKKFKGKINITSSMSCLVPVSHKYEACIGDVGSPVTVSDLVVAVVSNNYFCKKEGLPLVVTNIGDSGMFLTFTISEPIYRT